MTPPVTTEGMVEALTKINGVRNSIIGLQTLNWSEHVYPLVAALNAAGFEGMDYPEARENFGTMLERTNTAEDALATATSELAQLRAEGEAKDRAILLLLPFVDYAAGEGLAFVATEDGEHPEMDAADVMAAAAEALGLELGSDAYLALLPAGYDAIRAARAATAREG